MRAAFQESTNEASHFLRVFYLHNEVGRIFLGSFKLILAKWPSQKLH